MSPKRLGDLLLDAQSGFASGDDLSEGGVLQVRMNNVETDGSWNWSSRRMVPATENQLDRCLLSPGDVLFNATNSPELVGKSAIFVGAEEPVVFSNHFLRLRADPGQLNSTYLAHWLRCQWIKGTFQRLCNAWVNQASVRKESLLDLELSPPSLNQQERIATILDKADSLRRKRQEGVQLADEFVKASFFELVGDPVANLRGWPERSVSEIGIVTTGNTPDRSIDANFGDAIEWIKSDNINTPSHWLTTAREGLSAQGMKGARIVPAGSTLMTCIAGSPSCIGNVAMADRRVAFNQQINAITPKDDLDPKFLYLLLLFSKARIQATSTNSMKGMVSKGTLEKVRLIWPPKSLQERLVQVFNKVASLRTRMEETEQLNLYASLQAELLA